MLGISAFDEGIKAPTVNIQAMRSDKLRSALSLLSHFRAPLFCTAKVSTGGASDLTQLDATVGAVTQACDLSDP